MFFILEGIFFKVFGLFASARFFGEILEAVASIFLLWFYGKRFEQKDLFSSGVSSPLVSPYFFKKARFLNLDMPLVAFTIIYYLEAVLFKKNQEKGSWSLAGVAMGLTFLFKGIGIFYLAVGGVLLAVIGGRRYIPFFVKSTLLSLMIASLRPLALFLSGKLYLFEKYLYVQFFHTAVHDRAEEWNHFVYLKTY